VVAIELIEKLKDDAGSKAVDLRDLPLSLQPAERDLLCFGRRSLK